MAIVVSKFGGTSMGDADCMLRSADVSLQRKSNIVVVSATSGTTNDLIKLGELAEKGQMSEAESILIKIKNRHQVIAKDLKADTQSLQDLSILLSEMESIARGIFLLRDCSSKAKDVLMSLGERMSSVLFTVALRNVFADHKNKVAVKLLDVRSVLKTDDQIYSVIKKMYRSAILIDK